ncbi:MAG: DUF488 domain-containing protein [Planctomycetota bacterium]
MPDARTIYTVGYSTHELDDFLAILSRHAITAVADVRSHPTARLECYRQANLREHLRAVGIVYVFLGRELGARRDEPECYAGGQAVYDRVARLPAFADGLARLERGAAEHRIALMCAERDPLDCHRGVLIAPELTRRGHHVRHLMADGQIEDHPATEQRMIARVGVDPLFDTDLGPAELKRRAYAERGREIAHRRSG